LNPGNGHAYEAIEAQGTWEEANASAAGLSYLGAPGHLVTVTSVEETNFLLAAFGPRDSYALGGVQIDGPEPAGGWTWITGEPWIYTDWDNGEPNNVLIQGQFEDRLAWKTGTVGRWNDVAGDVYEGPGPGQYRMNGYFVEFDLPPTSAPNPEPTGPVARLSASPNPTGSGTSIAFALGQPDDVELAVFDLAGRRVRSLALGSLVAGRHAFAWDGRDDRDRPVANGVYFLKLRGSHVSLDGKVVRVR
jgi:hypothetical protein